MIASLRLQNFRSYKDDSFEFEPGVNIIIGPNTSGKTNLLEAILVVSRGKSYRNNLDTTIQDGKRWARLEAVTTEGQTRVAKISMKNESVVKEFEIDDKKLTRLSLQYKIPTILFEPNQLQQLTTSPGQRRALLDDILEQTEPGFGQARRAYERALRQRNTLLKQKGTANKSLFPWDVRLSELGGVIAKNRTELIGRMNKTISKTYSSLAGKDHKVGLAYQSSLDKDKYAQSMLKKLEQNLQLDRDRGFTGCGPHRDDLEISINGAGIHSQASRGEVRTILLALKMQESEIIQEKTEQKPQLLLDDVFGELDGKRRRALIRFFKDHQTFITTTDADVIDKHYSKANILVLSTN